MASVDDVSDTRQRPSERAQSSARRETTDTDECDVRMFEPGDRDGFIALYNHVLDSGGDHWFAWKYETNPFADHVPVVVAEKKGRVIGAKCAVTIRIRVGDRTVDALQPADTMVHPEHQRQGVFSRMTTFMKEYYAPRSPALFFNFPNEKTLAGARKHGWEMVGQVPTYYRIHRTSALVGNGSSGVAAPGFGLFDAVFGAYNRMRTGLGPSRPDVPVEGHDGVPATILAELYRRSVPDELHAERSEEFYDWRFANPKWTYRTYLAGRSGPDVGVVTGVGTRDGQSVVNVVDVAPLSGSDRRPALYAALRRICADSEDADVITVSGHGVPKDVLASLGFLPDTGFPLSMVSSPSAFVSRPLSGDGHWTIDGHDVRHMDDWLLTFADQDTR